MIFLESSFSISPNYRDLSIALNDKCWKKTTVEFFDGSNTRPEQPLDGQDNPS